MSKNTTIPQPDRPIPAKTSLQDMSLPVIAMDFMAAAFYLTAGQLAAIAQKSANANAEATQADNGA